MRRFYRLRLDRYHKGGAVTSRLTSETYVELPEACAEAVRLQHRLDAEAAPVLVHVVDADGIALWRVGSTVPVSERREDEGRRPQMSRIA